jgi:hypothetical protein
MVMGAIFPSLLLAKKTIAISRPAVMAGLVRDKRGHAENGRAEREASARIIPLK